MQVSMRLKGDGLALALRKDSATTRKTPDFCANRACNAISYRAFLTMPQVSPSTIPKELEVSTHGVTKSGRLSTAKKPRYRHVGSNPNSFASWIVLASFYPGSKFNDWTGNVFKRDKPDTHGTEEFWTWMAGTVARMVNARRSSTGFYAACARAVNVGFGMATGRFKASFPLKSVPASGVGDVNKASTLLSRGLAKVTPAANGNGLAKFSVAGTESDSRGDRGDLERIAGRVWQKSVDDEAESIMKHIADSYKESLGEAGIKTR